jgi:asparagine synthase (glutamine-hydrolysing)
MEELICEPPAIALYFVTKLAREHGVKVVLSGEGGDETFAGYNTYRNILALGTIRRLGPNWSHFAAALSSAAARLTGNQRFARVAKGLRSPLEAWYVGRTAASADCFHSLAGGLYTPDFREAVLSSGETATESSFMPGQPVSLLASMLYADTKTWLPDDLLIKADKMTMANSVELRVPLLDHRVVEFAAGLPDKFKIRRTSTKRVLKEALRRRVPAKLLDRKKAGFPLPITAWLGRDPYVKAFIADILTQPRSVGCGYFAGSAIRRLLEAKSPSPETCKILFSILILDLWYRAFMQDGVKITSTGPCPIGSPTVP